MPRLIASLPIIAAGLLAALAACGGDDAGPGPLATSTRDQLCQSDCERLVACEQPPTRTVAECVASCQREIGAWLRTDVALDLFACRDQLACGASDDACVVCTPTDAHARYEAACRANLATCDVDLDGYCEVSLVPSAPGDTGLICVITPEVIDQMTACLPAGLDCATATACLDDVFARNGVPF